MPAQLPIANKRSLPYMMQEEVQGPVNATLHCHAILCEAAGTSRDVNKEDKPITANCAS